MTWDQKSKTVPIISAIAFAVMIAVNVLANTLPLNGITTGEVSDSYPNLFAPAGYTFAVWGVIYLLLAGYTLFQLGVFGKKDFQGKEEMHSKTGMLFTVSSLANTAWIFAWHYRQLVFSMILMLIILLCLMAIAQIMHWGTLSPLEKIFIRLPFSVYFGWITVATIANMTTLLVSFGWTGTGFFTQTITVLVLIIGVLAGGASLIERKDIAYGATLVWAYTGILVKQVSPEGFAGKYPAVYIAVVICLAALLLGIRTAFVSIRGSRDILKGRRKDR